MLDETLAPRGLRREGAPGDPAEESEAPRAPPQQDVEPRCEDLRGEPAEAEMDLDLFIKHDDQDLRAALAVHARERRKAVEETYGDMVVFVASLSQDDRT